MKEKEKKEEEKEKQEEEEKEKQNGKNGQVVGCFAWIWLYAGIVGDKETEKE